MKSIIFISVFILFFCTLGICQKTLISYFNFEDYYYDQDTLWIDTVSNPNNIWEIGQPNKTVFQSAYSPPNAIVTKLDIPYPSNDTSSFIIEHIADMGIDCCGLFWITGSYLINSDTLTDFGIMEFSPNKGELWINLTTDETYTDYYYWSNSIFSGNSNDWQDFYFELSDWSHYFNIQYGDTILFKFTFISDDIQTDKDGWMLDNIEINDWYEGIEDLNNTLHSSVFPNPISDFGILRFDNPTNAPSIVEIYSVAGRLIKTLFTKTDRIEISGQRLGKGLYFYKIVTASGSGSGKFIVEH